ncbi:MAG: hypothetical protein HGA37_04220 [Lentimicrobium sp.]|nr:hypothetical protein [Lentimicrobium sp.]
MKRPVKFLYFFFLFLVPFLNSCEPTDDLGPDTGDPRDKFLGSWNFNESPASRDIDASYSVTISYDASNSSQVLLRNFASAGGQYSAYGIVTSNRITVPSQEMAPGFIVEGSGTMSSLDAMDWEYSIEAGGDLENFTAFASK